MSTHVVEYETKITEGITGDFRGRYLQGFDGACSEFRESFDEGFLTFEKDVSEAAVHLQQHTDTREGDHSVRRSSYAEVSHCPFCGAEIAFSEVFVTDER